VIYPRAIRWIADSRAKLCDNQVYLDGRRLEVPPVVDFD
jgi:hypothetical protein